MRRIMLTVALVLWASQIEAAVLFPPDSFRLDVTAVFNDTNTNTFCWQCGDSNPLNDFQAVLQSFPDLTDAWTDFYRTRGRFTCKAPRRTISGSTRTSLSVSDLPLGVLRCLKVSCTRA